MSKAFTKEDDSEPDRNTRVRSNSGLPPGALNYMTAEGARRFRSELAGIGDTQSERAAEIRRILDSASIVEPSTETLAEVLFGSVVEVRNAEGHSRTFRIVGVDEIEFDPSYVSWMSPIGKTLLGSVVGQRVMLNVVDESTAFTIARIHH
jgi:transcription elongation GreA/GreB family factor